jgi:uncharacterized protein YmfQ (DUF2313 family)
MLERDRHVTRTGSDYADAMSRLLPQGIAWPRDVSSLLMQVVRGLTNIWGTVETRASDLLERESDPRIALELLPDWERNWGLPDPCYEAPQTIGERQKALVQRMTIVGEQSRQFFIDAAAYIGYHITINEYRPFMVGVDRVGDNRRIGSPLYYRDGVTTNYYSGFGGVWSVFVPNSSGTGTPAGGVDGDIYWKTNDNTIWKKVAGTWYQFYTAVVGVTPGAPDPDVWGAYPRDQFGNPLLNDRGVQVAIGEYSSYPYVLGPLTNRYYWTVHVDTARLTWFRLGGGGGQTGIDPHLRIGLALDLECLLNKWKPAHTQIIFDYSGLTVGGSMAGTP